MISEPWLHYWDMKNTQVVSQGRKIPAGIYLLKVNNRNTRTRCQICSKLTIKIPDIFIVNFEHILRLVLVFLLLTLRG